MTRDQTFYAFARNRFKCVRTVKLNIAFLGAANDCLSKRMLAASFQACGEAQQRNIIERMFCRLKDWRRIATRYDRNIKNFMAATVIWWL